MFGCVIEAVQTAVPTGLTRDDGPREPRPALFKLRHRWRVRDFMITSAATVSLTLGEIGDHGNDDAIGTRSGMLVSGCRYPIARSEGCRRGNDERGGGCS